MNVILSAAFAYLTLWGLDLVGAVEFTIRTYLIGTLALIALTHVLIR